MTTVPSYAVRYLGKEYLKEKDDYESCKHVIDDLMTKYESAMSVEDKKQCAIELMTQEAGRGYLQRKYAHKLDELDSWIEYEEKELKNTRLTYHQEFKSIAYDPEHYFPKLTREYQIRKAYGSVHTLVREYLKEKGLQGDYMVHFEKTLEYKSAQNNIVVYHKQLYQVLLLSIELSEDYIYNLLIAESVREKSPKVYLLSRP